MNFLACGTGRPVVSRMKGTRLICGYLSNLFFSALSGHKSWFCAGCRDQGRTARERSNNRDIQIRDRTVEVKDKIHPSLFSLSIDNTGESRYFLFNEYLDDTMGLNNARKASLHCCMSAINTSSVPTAVAVMLLRVHWFVADDTRRTVCLGKTVPHLQRWRPPGAGASIFWLLGHESSDPQPRTLHCSAA